MSVRLKSDHTFPLLLKRTVSAQLHLLGSVLMILGSLYLLPLARAAGSLHYWACFSFLVSGTLVFSTSAIYHFLGDGFELSPRMFRLLENLDHFGIYLFIAGTYSPFILGTISSSWRIPLLITIWVIAIVGILYTWSKPRLPKILQHRAVYTFMFVLMGWTIVIRLGEVLSALSWGKLFLLVAGGMSYSLGAVVYATRRPRLFEGFFGYHELWHALVLLGAGFHYFLIFSFYSR
jgi:hemolysin III